MVRRLVLVLAASILAGCGPSPDGVVWHGTIDTAADGRVVVTNPAEPLLEDDAVGATERWTRRLRWSSDAGRLWEPGPVVRADGDRVWVLDPVHGRIEAHDARDGRHVRTLRPDDATEEGAFRGTHALAMTDGFLLVADTSTIGVFGPEGELVRRLESDANLIAVYGAGDGAFLVFAFGGGGASWRFHASPDSQARPYRPPVTRSETHPDAAQSECWKVEGLRDGLMLLSCAHPVVLRFDRASEIRREVAFARPPVEPSADQVAAVREAARERARARRPGLDARSVDRLAEREVRRHPLLKKHRAVRHDPASGRFAVLLQPPGYMGGGTAEVLLFSPEGRQLAALELEREWLDFDYRGGVLYAVARVPGSSEPVLVAREAPVGADSSSG